MGVKHKLATVEFDITPEWWNCSGRRTPELKAAVIGAIPAHGSMAAITVGASEVTIAMVLAVEDDFVELVEWIADARQRVARVEPVAVMDRATRARAGTHSTRQELSAAVHALATRLPKTHADVFELENQVAQLGPDAPLPWAEELAALKELDGNAALARRDVADRDVADDARAWEISVLALVRALPPCDECHRPAVQFDDDAENPEPRRRGAKFWCQKHGAAFVTHDWSEEISQVAALCPEVFLKIGAGDQSPSLDDGLRTVARAVRSEFARAEEIRAGVHRLAALLPGSLGDIIDLEANVAELPHSNPLPWADELAKLKELVGDG